MIKQAKSGDICAVAALARKLWPNSDGLEDELADMLGSDGYFFALWYEDGEAVGFAQTSIRRDYVEGTSGGAVGYLEGIYVEREFRRRGIGEALVARSEQWARGMGCAEFASDCELFNEESTLFHRGIGFDEANRVICFVKKL